jgi:putative RecB family exonuclease
MKSFTPNTEATPPAANTSRANGFAAAWSASDTLNISGNVTSNVNFVASGFGVVDGVAVATLESYAGGQRALDRSFERRRHCDTPGVRCWDMTDLSEAPTSQSMPSTPETPGAYVVPTSLSPSRVSAFTSCPMQFRFASIQKLPEAPGVATTKGTIVHRALELLFVRPRGSRTPEALHDDLTAALHEFADHPDYVGLRLDPDGAAAFAEECRELVEKYFAMEDPNAVREIGLELWMEAPVGHLNLRGIIDRLELDADGELVVTDYKTGRAPSGNYEQKSLAGVQFYSFLCEAVFGKRPAKIRLMYLKSGETIETVPSAQSVKFITTRTSAVWSAVERACTSGDFRPRPSSLCGFCSFKQWCPAFGGDPDLAADEAIAAYEALLAGSAPVTVGA